MRGNGGGQCWAMLYQHGSCPLSSAYSSFSMARAMGNGQSKWIPPLNRLSLSLTFFILGQKIGQCKAMLHIYGSCLLFNRPLSSFKLLILVLVLNLVHKKTTRILGLGEEEQIRIFWQSLISLCHQFNASSSSLSLFYFSVPFPKETGNAITF